MHVYAYSGDVGLEKLAIGESMLSVTWPYFCNRTLSVHTVLLSLCLWLEPLYCMRVTS